MISSLLDFVDAIAHVVQTIENVCYANANADESGRNPHLVTLLFEVSRVFGTCSGYL